MWIRKMFILYFPKVCFAYLFLSGIFFYRISGFTYYYTRILYSCAHIIITITKIIVQSFEFFPVRLNIIYTSLWCPNRPEIRIFSNPHNRAVIFYTDHSVRGQDTCSFYSEQKLKIQLELELDQDLQNEHNCN